MIITAMKWILALGTAIVILALVLGYIIWAFTCITSPKNSEDRSKAIWATLAIAMLLYIFVFPHYFVTYNDPSLKKPMMEQGMGISLDTTKKNAEARDKSHRGYVIYQQSAVAYWLNGNPKVILEKPGDRP